MFRLKTSYSTVCLILCFIQADFLDTMAVVSDGPSTDDERESDGGERESDGGVLYHFFIILIDFDRQFYRRRPGNAYCKWIRDPTTYVMEMGGWSLLWHTGRYYCTDRPCHSLGIGLPAEALNALGMPSRQLQHASALLSFISISLIFL